MAVNEADSGQASPDNASRADPLNSAIDKAFSAQDGATAEAAEKVTTPQADGPDKSKPDVLPDAKTNAGDKAETEQADKAKATDETAIDSKAVSDDKAKAVEPPQHWTAEDKSAFAKVPKEGQEIVLKLARNLQAGFTRKSQEHADTVRFASNVRELFDDTTKSQMTRAGLDEAGTIGYLLDLQRKASADPVAYVKWFMQEQGITGDHLGLVNAAAKNDLANSDKSPDVSDLRDLLADPEVKQLKTELAQLKGFIGSIQAQSRQEQESRYLQGVQSIQSTIGQFRGELDDTGQLAHPHFDLVQAHMGAMMEHDPDLKKLPDGPEKLKKAYDMAVWARPDLRVTFLEQDRSQHLAEARKKEEAERAKRVTAIKPSTGAPLSKQKPKSLDDIISESMSKVGI